jgi:hypothetical protein
VGRNLNRRGKATERVTSVGPILSNRINDEHRRDLLREASTERLAYDARQPHIAEPARTRKRASLISVDMLLLQAGFALTRRDHIAFYGDKTR